jgi:hypothetical protein
MGHDPQNDGGEVLQWTETDHACVACMLGGHDGTTLFMRTADSSMDKGCAENLQRLTTGTSHRPTTYRRRAGARCRLARELIGDATFLAERSSTLGGSRRHSRHRTEKFIRTRDEADENVSAVPIDGSSARIAGRCG